MCVWLFGTPLTVARHVASLSMGFSQQEYCSGLPFLPLGDLPSPGIKLKFLASPALAGRFFTTEPLEFVPNSIVVDLLFALRADSWILLLLHSICCNILFWLKYMRKSWLHTVGEESYFYSFSNDLGYDYLVLYLDTWQLVFFWHVFNCIVDLQWFRYTAKWISYIYSFSVFFHLGYYKILNIVCCACSKSVLFIYFMYSNVYMLILSF